MNLLIQAANEMAETDWVRVAIDAAIGLGSGAAGIIGGAFRFGRSTAKHEQTVKEDFDGKIAALREETRSAMAKNTETADARNALLVEQFKESFDGIRRQIDDHKLQTEQRFLLKEDFKDFREEYREDIRDIKTGIANITRQ